MIKVPLQAVALWHAVSVVIKYISVIALASSNTISCAGDSSRECACLVAPLAGRVIRIRSTLVGASASKTHAIVLGAWRPCAQLDCRHADGVGWADRIIAHIAPTGGQRFDPLAIVLGTGGRQAQFSCRHTYRIDWAVDTCTGVAFFNDCLRRDHALTGVLWAGFSETKFWRWHTDAVCWTDCFAAGIVEWLLGSRHNNTLAGILFAVVLKAKANRWRWHANCPLGANGIRA